MNLHTLFGILGVVILLGLIVFILVRRKNGLPRNRVADVAVVMAIALSLGFIVGSFVF